MALGDLKKALSAPSVPNPAPQQGEAAPPASDELVEVIIREPGQEPKASRVTREVATAMAYGAEPGSVVLANDPDSEAGQAWDQIAHEQLIDAVEPVSAIQGVMDNAVSGAVTMGIQREFMDPLERAAQEKFDRENPLLAGTARWGAFAAATALTGGGRAALQAGGKAALAMRAGNTARVALHDLGARQAWRAAGSLIPGGSASVAAGQGARALAARAMGIAPTAGTVGQRMALRGAEWGVEGALMEAQFAVTDAMLEDTELSAEYIMSRAGLGAVMGLGLGAAASAAGGAWRGLTKFREGPKNATERLITQDLEEAAGMMPGPEMDAAESVARIMAMSDTQFDAWRSAHTGAPEVLAKIVEARPKLRAQLAEGRQQLSDDMVEVLADLADANLTVRYGDDIGNEVTTLAQAQTPGTTLNKALEASPGTVDELKVNLREASLEWLTAAVGRVDSGTVVKTLDGTLDDISVTGRGVYEGGDAAYKKMLEERMGFAPEVGQYPSDALRDAVKRIWDGFKKRERTPKPAALKMDPKEGRWYGAKGSNVKGNGNANVFKQADGKWRVNRVEQGPNGPYAQEMPDVFKTGKAAKAWVKKQAWFKSGKQQFEARTEALRTAWDKQDKYDLMVNDLISRAEKMPKGSGKKRTSHTLLQQIGQTARQANKKGVTKAELWADLDAFATNRSPSSKGHTITSNSMRTNIEKSISDTLNDAALFGEGPRIATMYKNNQQRLIELHDQVFRGLGGKNVRGKEVREKGATVSRKFFGKGTEGADENLYVKLAELTRVQRQQLELQGKSDVFRGGASMRAQELLSKNMENLELLNALNQITGNKAGRSLDGWSGAVAQMLFGAARGLAPPALRRMMGYMPTVKVAKAVASGWKRGREMTGQGRVAQQARGLAAESVAESRTAMGQAVDAASSFMRGQAPALNRTVRVMGYEAAGSLAQLPPTRRTQVYNEIREQVEGLVGAPEAMIQGMEVGVERLSLSDPELAQAMNLRAAMGLYAMRDAIPDHKKLNVLSGQPDRASPEQEKHFLRVVQAANRPETLAEEVAQGYVHEATIQTVRKVYPQQYALMVTAISDSARKVKGLDYYRRLLLGDLTGMNYDATQESSFIAAMEQADSQTPEQAAALGQVQQMQAQGNAQAIAFQQAARRLPGSTGSTAQGHRNDLERLGQA